ncbi:MAG: hypothetical protein NC217_05735 [Muribaculaceae bacterium]|nr:hypothetical protein [Muribaculaceae bacterium]
MKSSLRILYAALLCALSSALPAFAKDVTLTMNVEIVYEDGTPIERLQDAVEVSITTEENTTDYRTSGYSVSSKFTGVSTFGTASQTFYVNARIKDEYKDLILFDGWYENKNHKSSDFNYSTTVSNSSLSKTANATLTAKFIRNGASLGELQKGTWASLSDEKNLYNDEVTATTWTEVPFGDHRMPNKAMKFTGWYDSKDNLLSTDPSYTFTVTGRETITPRYEIVLGAPEAGKYYRIRNAANRVLTTEGNFRTSIEVKHDGQTTDIDSKQMRWALDTNHDIDTFGGLSFSETDSDVIDANSAPQTIYYVTNHDNTVFYKDGAQFASQGTDTKAIFDQYFKVSEVGDDAPGFYYLKAHNAIYAGLRTRHDDNNCIVEIGPMNNNNKDYHKAGAMIFEPVDEEHKDEFWFGVNPQQALYKDEYYWTTMYTSFPYECLDEGVCAYYIKKTVQNDVAYAICEPVPAGVVPANTAVLIRCASLNSKENRLMPISPDDSRINTTAAEGNLLIGSFQLYTNAEGEGRTALTDNLYELSIEEHGQVAFCPVSAPAPIGMRRAAGDGMMRPNVAYLNTSAFLADGATPAPGYIVFDSEISTGIIGIEADTKDATPEYYNLQGVRINAPVPGTFVIERRGTTVSKHIYR